MTRHLYFLQIWVIPVFLDNFVCLINHGLLQIAHFLNGIGNQKHLLSHNASSRAEILPGPSRAYFIKES